MHFHVLLYPFPQHTFSTSLTTSGLFLAFFLISMIEARSPLPFWIMYGHLWFYQLFPIGRSWTIEFSLPTFFSAYLYGFWTHIKVLLSLYWPCHLNFWHRRGIGAILNLNISISRHGLWLLIFLASWIRNGKKDVNGWKENAQMTDQHMHLSHLSMISCIRKTIELMIKASSPLVSSGCLLWPRSVDFDFMLKIVEFCSLVSWFWFLGI